MKLNKLFHNYNDNNLCYSFDLILLIQFYLIFKLTFNLTLILTKCFQ